MNAFTLSQFLVAFAEAETAERDIEWWSAIALNDAVAPTPEAVKKYVIDLRELAVKEAVNRAWISVSERLPEVKGHYIFRYREDNCPVVNWYSPISADKDWYIKAFSVWAHILSYEPESGGEQ